jgi:hypothetical protein
MRQLQRPGKQVYMLVHMLLPDFLPSTSIRDFLAANVGDRHVRVVIRVHHEQERLARSLIYNFLGQVNPCSYLAS